jgi:hypothetical protein
VNVVETCANCGHNWPEDRFNKATSAPNWCFACRSKSVSVTFQGGRDYFKSDTEGNRSRLAVAEAKAAGFDPVPAESKGWNSVSGVALRSVGDVSKQVGAFGKKPTADSGAKVGV